MWPGSDQGVAKIWPGGDHDISRRLSGYVQDVTRVWTAYDHVVVKVCPGCGQYVDWMRARFDQGMVMVWPVVDHDVSMILTGSGLDEPMMWPGYGNDMTRIWPICDRVWPECDWDMTRMWPYVVSIWPGCGHKVARIWRMCHDMVMMWPSCGQDVAKLWPGCGQVVARIWLYCDQGVGNHKAKWISFIQYYSDTYSNRSCYVTFPFEAKWTWIITRVLSAKRIFDPVSNWVYFVSISKLLSIPKWWLPWHRIVSFAYGEGGLTCLNRKYVYFLLPLLCFRDKLCAVYSRHVLINLHTSSLLWRNTIIFKHQNVSIIIIQLSIACCQLL